MFRPTPLLILAVASAAALPASAGARPGSGSLEPAGALSDEAIVRFEPGVAASERREARDAAGVQFEDSTDLKRVQVVSVSGSVRTAVRLLERQPGVAYAQPNYRYQAQAAPPNDSFFGQLWGLGGGAGVGAQAAWELTRGAGQTIAIVDTGVDLTHPDLAGNLWSNPAEAPGGGDGDGNGKVDDVHGYDFVQGDANPDDFEFHGTHVAGTAAARAGNGLGVAGVAPEAEIMAVRALDGDGAGSSVTVAQAIEYAAAEGADVINLSLGGPAAGGDHLMADALALARSADAVAIAAAGNEGTNNDAMPYTPCTLPASNLICVAAATQGGSPASFSNRGAVTVDLAAPGTSIISTKSDWGQLFADDFELGAGAWTQYEPFGPAVDWGITSVHSEGTKGFADSPGGNYAGGVYSEARKATGVDLTSRRGCRLHVHLKYALQQPGPQGQLTDYLAVGAFDGNNPSVDVERLFEGSSGGAFEPTQISVSGLDGRPNVRPFLGLDANSDGIQADGAYADRLRLLCRDGTYTNTVASRSGYDIEPGSYVAFDGTSMAAPHVAGVAALVRAADPAAGADEVVRAITTGVTPVAAQNGKTASGGLASAVKAIEAVLGEPLVGTDPAPAPRGEGDIGPSGVAPPVATPTLLEVSSARNGVRVTRSGRFNFSFRAAPGVNGRVVFRTRGKVRRPGRAGRARLTLASLGFAGGGRVKLRVRLSRGELAVLRLHRRLALTVSVRGRDDTGVFAKRSARLTLLAPRRAPRARVP